MAEGTNVAEIVEKPQTGELSPPNIEEIIVPQTENERIMSEELKKLRPLAEADPMLTEIKNKRVIQEILHKHIDSVIRHPDRRVSALMFDGDEFKLVNDTYGHLVGDEVLHYIAGRLKGSLRPSDDIGRFGGEEFLVILTDTDEEQAKEAGDRLREGIAKKPFVSSKGDVIDLRVSVGVSTFPSHVSRDEYEERPKDADQNRKRLTNLGNQLIGNADKALYESKRNGRNRTTVFQPTMDTKQHSEQPSS